MPRAGTHSRIAAARNQDERFATNFSGALAGLRDLPQGRSPGPARTELPAVPQFHGLESGNANRSLEDEIPTHRSARPGTLREVPYAGRAGPSSALYGNSIRQMLRLPQRSASRRVRAILRNVPHDERLEENSSQPAVRSFEDEISSTGKACAGGLCPLPYGRKFQEACRVREMLGLPHARPAPRPVRRAQGQRRMLGVPQCGRLEAFALHGEGARGDRVSARRKAFERGVREVPHPGGRRDALQNSIQPLHGLPLRYSPGAVCRGSLQEPVRAMPHDQRIPAFDFHHRAASEEPVPARRGALGSHVRGMPQSVGRRIFGESCCVPISRSNLHGMPQRPAPRGIPRTNGGVSPRRDARRLRSLPHAEILDGSPEFRPLKDFLSASRRARQSGVREMSQTKPRRKNERRILPGGAGELFRMP